MTLTEETAVATGTERDRLLDRFADRIIVNTDLDRRLVSFQGNRDQPFYGWLKYKEGFSAALVGYFLNKLAPRPGVLLDPFAGAGAALFAARDEGWDTIGIEVLPVGAFAIRARLEAERVRPETLRKAVQALADVDFGEFYDPEFAPRHVPITKDAYPDKNEKELAGYLAYCRRHFRDPAVRTLLEFAGFCVLETASYTRKDGQYLRWDHRSGRRQGIKVFDKGSIPSFRQAVMAKLQTMAQDVSAKSLLSIPGRKGNLDLRKGSCLDILPTMTAGSVDFVLTSPPYCNRYDYTRTYALELVFLGCGRDDIRDLRQRMLSCTVENNEKVSHLREAYDRRGDLTAWEEVDSVFREQDGLQEVLAALEHLKAQDALNNQNVVRMVRNYFYEMAFVIYELSRVMRRKAKAVIVNDNVRYAGEEVPADLILCDFAERFGLRAKHIWALPRGKGNSSQQMGNHGRTELRKCVYVWEKP